MSGQVILKAILNNEGFLKCYENNKFWHDSINEGSLNDFFHGIILTMHYQPQELQMIDLDYQ